MTRYSLRSGLTVHCRPMHKHLPTLAVSLVLTAAIVVPTATLLASVKPASIVYGGKTYYRVIGGNKTQNTGAKVCALVGKACIGYTAINSNDICKALHPKAKTAVSTSGSRSGFYCNGSPQKGPACEKMLNTCEVCPTCNINASCATDIGNQFREMYIECGPLSLPASSSSSASAVRSVKSSSSSSSKPVKSVSQIGPFPGKIACDFYQSGPNKIASCRNLSAANAFCVIAMKSPLAKAAECNDNGRVVCLRPCVTNPAQAPLPRCAYDPERRSGYQSTPYNFCGR